MAIYNFNSNPTQPSHLKTWDYYILCMQCASVHTQLSEYKFEISNLKSGGVGWGGDVAAVAGPVGVYELPRAREQLVGVGSEVVSLGLDQVGRNFLRSM